MQLRDSPEEAAFREGAASAMGVALPRKPCTISENGLVRVVWVGPDDWFIVGPSGQPEAIALRLREALSGMHHAVTDVSSGYTVLHLSGRPVRDVLAQGCPLDLHPRAFRPGMAVTTTLARVPLILWQVRPDAYRLLPRSSFADYVARWLVDAMQEFA